MSASVRKQWNLEGKWIDYVITQTELKFQNRTAIPGTIVWILKVFTIASKIPLRFPQFVLHSQMLSLFKVFYCCFLFLNLIVSYFQTVLPYTFVHTYYKCCHTFSTMLSSLI